MSLTPPSIRTIFGSEMSIASGLRSIQLTSPPPMNNNEIATCSKSIGDQASPHAVMCSKKTFVIPYIKTREHSVVSIDIELYFLRDCRFHAHPRSRKQPVQRPSVRVPKKNMTPPLMKCASPLKICLSCCFKLEGLAHRIPKHIRRFLP